MALVEALRPDLERIHGTIIERRDNPSKYPNSSTVRLFKVGWVSTEPQTVGEKGAKAPPSIGGKLVEEGAEVAAARTREDVIIESSQVLYYVMVGCAWYGITPGVLLEAVNNTLDAQEGTTVPLNKLSESAGTAAGQLAMAGVKADRKLVTQEDVNLVTLRAAETVVALGRLWAPCNISPEEVGKKI